MGRGIRVCACWSAAEPPLEAGKSTQPAHPEYVVGLGIARKGCMTSLRRGSGQTLARKAWALLTRVDAHMAWALLASVDRGRCGKVTVSDA